jgi:hypothetical protein
MFVIKSTSGFTTSYLRPNKYIGVRSWTTRLAEARVFEDQSDALSVLANTNMSVKGVIAVQAVKRDVRGMPWNVEEFAILMNSDTVDSRTYRVVIRAESATCTCPDYKFRGRCCKHIRRALDMTGMKSVTIREA